MKLLDRFQDTLALGLLLFTISCGGEPPSPGAESPDKAPTTPEKPKLELPATPPGQTLPGADHLFKAELAPGREALFGADGTTLWAAVLDADGRTGHVMWRLEGQGSPAAITAGDIGNGWRVYVAWGLSRADRQAPVVLQSVDPVTGESVEIGRWPGARNMVLNLSLADVDRDGATELVLAHHADKYHVVSRSFEADGSETVSEPIRMAWRWAFADVDGDGKSDRILGRPYGDDGSAVGDLRVDFGQGWVQVPTDKGVQAVAFGKAGSDSEPAIYFADGWSRNYGKEGKAQVKRARFKDGTWDVVLVANSPDEYMLQAIELIDVDGDGQNELLALGNKRLSLVSPAATTPWPMRTLATGQAPNTSVALRADDGTMLLHTWGKPSTRQLDVNQVR